MNDNLALYNALRTVPQTAKKEIQAGKLKGFTDINPMWRIKARNARRRCVCVLQYQSVCQDGRRMVGRYPGDRRQPVRFTDQKRPASLGRMLEDGAYGCNFGRR